MASDAPELAVHKEWLGQIQPVGLVVSPYVLVRHGVVIDRQTERRDARRACSELIERDEETGRVDDFLGPLRETCSSGPKACSPARQAVRRSRTA